MPRPPNPVLEVLRDDGGALLTRDIAEELGCSVNAVTRNLWNLKQRGKVVIAMRVHEDRKGPPANLWRAV